MVKERQLTEYQMNVDEAKIVTDYSRNSESGVNIYSIAQSNFGYRPALDMIP